MFSKDLFGQRLLAFRKQNHEKQEELAAVLETTKSHISEMENGKKTTTLEKFARLCEHYHVSADYLLGFTDDPTPRFEEDTDAVSH